MNVAGPVRVTRKLPAVEVTRAIPPVAANGELAAIVTATAPPVTLPATVGNGEPGMELVGLPPHAGNSATPLEIAATDVIRLQNSRRLCNWSGRDIRWP